MSNRNFLKLLLLLVVALVVLPARGANPRDVDATAYGDSVSLGPEWLFHPGDDPQWASPTLDDHDWTIISAQRQLPSYGFRDLRYGWYRMHIRLRPGAPAPVVMLNGVNGSYEVFANGVRIGGHGPMGSHDFRTQIRPLGYSVPARRSAAAFSHSPSASTSTPTDPTAPAPQPRSLTRPSLSARPLLTG